MQVSIETLDGLSRRMTVQVPSEIVDQGVAEKLNELKKSVRIDGFRPGKVPVKVLQQKYGSHVRQEVIDNVIQSSYHDALAQEKVRPAGMPVIESVNSEDKPDMSYVATFEVYPEFEQLKFGSIEIEKPVAEVTDDDLGAMFEKLRNQRKEWVEVDRKAAKSDQIMIDYEGRIDGELFEGGAAKDSAIEIGSGQMIEDFEAGLIGMSAGETKEVPVTFPDNYQNAAFAGKQAVFTFRANKVSEAKLPEVDEEFAKSYGVEDGDLDKFRVDVRASMESELKQKIKQQVKNKTMNGLIEANQFVAPTAFVAEEIKALKERAVQRIGQDPTTFDFSQVPDDLFKDEAEKRTKLSILMAEVIKSENIELDRGLVDSNLAEMVKTYDDPDQVSEYYRNNAQARSSLESMVLEDQVITHILSLAQVAEKQSSFDEIMNNPGQ